MSVSPIPAGYHTITPYLVCADAQSVLEFLKTAFDADLKHCSRMGDKIMNAEVKVGNSMVMVASSQADDGGRPATIYMYVEDTDAFYKKAIAAGAKSIMEPADQFYGDRNAGVEDVSGNQWWIATHIEDVSEEEILRRAKEHGK